MGDLGRRRWNVAGWPGTREWTWGILALGLGLRLWHYLRDPSIWGDEAALVINVLGKSYRELLGPLFFSEAAPPLFLWLEKAVSQLCGDGLYGLRFPAFVASCAAMLVMVPLSRRLLRPHAAGWALLLFAVSDRLLWHACEAKQYAGDCLAGAGLLWLYVAGRERPLVGQLLWLAALAPLLLAMSYPASFLYGGLLVAYLPDVWRAVRGTPDAGAPSGRGWQVVACYGLLIVAVFGSFGALMAGPIGAQRNAEIISCWETLKKFPDYSRPWSVPLWSLLSTLDLVDYACRPVGHLLAPLVVVGAIYFWRRRQPALLTLMLLPPGLAFLASLAKAYPYGGVRVLAYSLPALVLLLAAGVPPTLAWLGQRSRLAHLALTLVLLAPAGRTLWRVAYPWSRANSSGAAAYVMAHRQAGEYVTGNDWDYRYLFRNLGPAFTPMDRFQAPTSGRLWAAVTAGTQEDRLLVYQNCLPQDWRVCERHEFTRTTLYLLESPAHTARAHGASQ